MRKQNGKLNGISLTAGLLVIGLATGVTAYAANEDTGTSSTLADNDYSLEEMLTYAIEDEYLAQAEYNVIIDEFGVQRPFSNIVKAEATHISLLEPLFEEYGVSIPDKDWESMVTVPGSIEEAYAAGVDAEEKNIAMYEGFLDKDLPDDVKDVFEKLMNASYRHLTAFERQVDGTGCGSGACDGTGYGNGTGNGMHRGAGNSGAGGRAMGCQGTGTCTL